MAVLHAGGPVSGGAQVNVFISYSVADVEAQRQLLVVGGIVGLLWLFGQNG